MFSTVVANPSLKIKQKRNTGLIKVLIIEDNRYMHEGWRTFIDYDKELVVLGDFVSCEDAIASGLVKKAIFLSVDGVRYHIRKLYRFCKVNRVNSIAKQ